jgi:hypothetical protein
VASLGSIAGININVGVHVEADNKVKDDAVNPKTG